MTPPINQDGRLGDMIDAEQAAGLCEALTGLDGSDVSRMMHLSRVGGGRHVLPGVGALAREWGGGRGEGGCAPFAAI